MPVMTRLPRLFSAALGALALAGPAAAHAFLEEASPKVGGKVAASPREVRLSFDDDLTAATSGATLYDAAGRPLAEGAAHLDARDASVLVLPLTRALPPGRYQVRWRAGTPDHHVSTGDFSFQVGA
jgi:methionine-rich copper-binding protein CopC